MAREKHTSGSSRPCPIYAVHGQDAWLKCETIRDLTRSILGDADRTLCLSEYDGSSAATEAAEVLDDVRTPSLLADRRLVIVRDADRFISANRDTLEEYAANPCLTGVLLIECKSLPVNTNLCKAIVKAGRVIKCEPVGRRELNGWLVNRCQQVYGLRIDARAVELLRRLIGDDLGLLDGELQKLSLFVAGRNQITAGDVESLTGHCREEKVWGILAAIAARDTRQALTLWEDVWQTDRAASERAIGGIAFRVRQLLNLQRALKAGASMGEACKRLAIWDDLQLLRRQTSALPIAELEQMLCRLLDADAAVKIGQAEVRSAVEAFIVRACEQDRRRRATA